MARGTPGLRKRGGIWHIQKRIRGYGPLHESTGTGDLEEAERYLAHRRDEIRQILIYGERPRRSFAEAAEKYLAEIGDIRSLATTAHALRRVLPYIGELQLEDVHDDTLAAFKRACRRQGLAAGTINRSLGVVRRILNLAARKWRDGSRTWLATPPLIDMVKGKARRPYPLSWNEQSRLFAVLPPHLQPMALFKVNTGCREQEVCQLQWDWEVRLPELGTSVFILPEWLTKNGEERVVVLNSVARQVVDERRGSHLTHVFSFRGHPVNRINNTAWRKATSKSGLRHVRVHDLKHTFGHRLRTAGVGLEDRKPLLGHTTGEITTHYSAPDLARLIECAERVCERRQTTILRIVGQN